MGGRALSVPPPGLTGPLLCLSRTGYYYDLDDSYDESDEEEVRAHLRCVAEQPPLKLDTSSEVCQLFEPAEVTLEPMGEVA